MIGKAMTKMTLPVSFNEPTSLLQRVAEDMEYTDHGKQERGLDQAQSHGVSHLVGDEELELVLQLVIATGRNERRIRYAQAIVRN